MGWRIIGQEMTDLKSYFCDTCGCQLEDLTKNIATGNDGSMKILAEFGYISDRDGERYEYFLCHRCAGDVLKYLEMLKALKDATIDI
jgi:hypothetical protein